MFVRRVGGVITARRIAQCGGKRPAGFAFDLKKPRARDLVPGIDAAVVHLGGTRVLMRTVTMDGPMGVDFVERCAPAVVVPVHHDDYKVFRSPLSDFVRRSAESGTSAVLRCPRRGEVVSLEPPA